ncbi:hypothetical protein [Aneurinibacillus terranovensis]|uniref:hypothetical protein n=1 Tax=Aneurinibacillus terranovensis TaxID=278991 RepID=UPI000420F7FA|nr:hypothetical protein [Aneurinibacillus terranovensis]
MRTRKWIMISIAVLLILGGLAAYTLKPEYAYIPSENKVVRGETNDIGALDIWGKTVTKEGMVRGKSSALIRSVKNGAIPIDAALLQVGRKAFYQETFGNEVFLTDILGIVNGPLTIPAIMKAIVKLKGKGTTNLQVELTRDAIIGGKIYRKGSKIDTGIDVAAGTYAPIGMPVSFSEGRLKVGISCAACHATVDPVTKKVVEGAPNSDLNTGMLLALATNSAAYFTHADTAVLQNYIKNTNRSSLPDPAALEAAVDDTFAKWPRGSFDSTTDLKANPTSIPDSFTLGDHPYGWSGFAAAGPFKGLSSLNNNVHAQNSDTLSQSETSKALFGIDKEVFIGTILQNAANPKYRYNPGKRENPSAFFINVDPTPGAPGVNELVRPPQFPKVSVIAPDGLIAGSPGYHVNEQNNAMAAWQNTLSPPKIGLTVTAETARLGRSVFGRAGCIMCHAGETFTNHRVIPAQTIGTEPTRAQALKKTEKIFSEPTIYPPDTPVPVPPGTPSLKVPIRDIDRQQIRLAYAHGNTQGGYKVPSLIGLYWSAPYLHDGGVAVGRDSATDLGVAGTLEKGIQPDPYNSLRALVDRNLRKKVVSSNQSSKDLQKVHVQGIGHEYWVDKAAGFTSGEQDALIRYLFTLTYK